MEIRELEDNDASSAIALWTETGLTRPWNDPEANYLRASNETTSAVLGHKHRDELVGTVMVGFDGHRGWVYYLAVAQHQRGEGIRSALMTLAEQWLRERGASKVQLMVRTENESALRFYGKFGYEPSDVVVLARWLEVETRGLVSLSNT